jgi:hypothetical protein
VFLNTLSFSFLAYARETMRACARACWCICCSIRYSLRNVVGCLSLGLKSLRIIWLILDLQRQSVISQFYQLDKLVVEKASKATRS